MRAFRQVLHLSLVTLSASSTPPATARSDLLSPAPPTDPPYCLRQFPTWPARALRNAPPCVSCGRRQRPSNHHPSQVVRRWPCPRRERGDVARSADRP